MEEKTEIILKSLIEILINKDMTDILKKAEKDCKELGDKKMKVLSNGYNFGKVIGDSRFTIVNDINGIENLNKDKIANIIYSYCVEFNQEIPDFIKVDSDDIKADCSSDINFFVLGFFLNKEILENNLFLN